MSNLKKLDSISSTSLYWQCAKNVYNIIMKQKDLVRKLIAAGFSFARHGGNHDIYVRNEVIEKVPRHKEVNEILAKAILKRNGIK